jgi:pimeloyl-ACP methyl ester carboxylesterase
MSLHRDTRLSTAIGKSSRRTALGWAATAGTALAGLINLPHAAVSASSRSGAIMSQSTPQATPADASGTPTVVLVHGSFADASSWAGVIGILQAEGIATMAPANPLRSVSGDAAYIASVVNQVPGPVLLVGHSYGGVVITNAAPQTDNVVGLVYVAAFLPDEGESVLGLADQATDSLLGPALRPAEFPAGPDGEIGHELYIDQAAFHEVFCADLPAEQAAAMAVSQRPSAEATFGEPSGPAGWKTLPSWAIVATADHAIGATGERFMAERAGAITIEVDASHVVMTSQPQAVADLIMSALGTVG